MSLVCDDDDLGRSIERSIVDTASRKGQAQQAATDNYILQYPRLFFFTTQSRDMYAVKRKIIHNRSRTTYCVLHSILRIARTVFQEQTNRSEAVAGSSILMLGL